MARIICDEEKNLFGAKIREIRVSKGMSQQTLADKLETLAVYICRGSISRDGGYV